MASQCYTKRPMETRAPAVRVRELGHVSLFVRDLDASRRFYRDTLGLAETGTAKDGRIDFFSAGVHHHDLSCELARAPGPGPQPKGGPGRERGDREAEGRQVAAPGVEEPAARPRAERLAGPDREREPAVDRAERRAREDVRGARGGDDPAGALGHAVERDVDDEPGGRARYREQRERADAERRARVGERQRLGPPDAGREPPRRDRPPHAPQAPPPAGAPRPRGGGAPPPAERHDERLAEERERERAEAGAEVGDRDRAPARRREPERRDHEVGLAAGGRQAEPPPAP